MMAIAKDHMPCLPHDRSDHSCTFDGSCEQVLEEELEHRAYLESCRGDL